MKRSITVVATVVLAIIIGGCSIAGTWKTVKVEPEGTMHGSPFQMVTFTEDGQYSASHQYGEDLRTSAGKYKWDGMKLTVMPAEGEERVYPGHWNMFTGHLVLSHQAEGEKVTATLEKQTAAGE